MGNLNYIRWIQDKKITIVCEDEAKRPHLKRLGAKRKFFNNKVWIINSDNENDLANKLQQLNNKGFMFAGGTEGWNPIDIFIDMRNKKLITGNATEIVWVGKEQTRTRIV